jgi:hypothetical protein
MDDKSRLRAPQQPGAVALSHLQTPFVDFVFQQNMYNKRFAPSVESSEPTFCCAQDIQKFKPPTTTNMGNICGSDRHDVCIFSHDYCCF